MNARGLMLVALLAASACVAPGLDDDRGGSSEAAIDQKVDGAKCTATDATLAAFPGGSSIALRWSVLGGNAEGVARWVVYRDGKQLATVTPGFHPDFPEKDGKGYIDRAITPNATYAYRVEEVDTKGATKTLGGSLCVKAPPTFSPPPTITIDASKAPDLAGFGQQVKAFLEIWYPKLAYALAQPDYEPMSAYLIRFDLDQPVGGADQGRRLIGFSAKFIREHTSEMLGAYLHESVHLLTESHEVPAWLTEGIADYSREYILHDREPPTRKASDSYLDGYSTAAGFLHTIEKRHGVGLVRPLTVAMHADKYSKEIFVQKTGKTIAQLWEEQTGIHEREPGLLRFAGLANKCVDGSFGKATVATCGDSELLTWVWGEQREGGGLWIASDRARLCLDVSNSSHEMGAGVGTHGCNGSGAQTWKLNPDGTLLNPQSGLCLDSPDGKTVDGTPLRLWQCNGSSAQRFTLPQ